MKEYKLNKKQHEKDSQVFGAIMAGVRARKKRLKPGLPGMETPKNMCAVGAGNRGLNVTQPSDVITKSFIEVYGEYNSSTRNHQLIPLIRFATANGVSDNYACGVNDGFENQKGISGTFYPNVNLNTLDYERGWHVGQAVREVSGW